MTGRAPLLALMMLAAMLAVSACGGATAQPTAAPTAAKAPAAQPTAAPAAATKPAAQPGTTAGNVAAGKAVFDQNCNSCHPNGGSGAGPSLKGRNLSAQRIENQVRRGGGGMPAFSQSQISDQQLQDLVAYIQSLG